jgi:hypothetical protein
MSEAKFTPGPWKVENVGTAQDPEWCIEAPTAIIADDVEDPNNAALIAAAPAMYDFINDAKLDLVLRFAIEIADAANGTRIRNVAEALRSNRHDILAQAEGR